VAEGAFEIICNDCGTSVPADHQVCPGCGDVLFTYDRSGTVAHAVPAAAFPAFRRVPQRAHGARPATVPSLTRDDYRRAARLAGVSASWRAALRLLLPLIAVGLLILAIVLALVRFGFS
jgi:hypothetical protein